MTKREWRTPAVVTRCGRIDCERAADAAGFCPAHGQRAADAKERLRRATAVLAGYMDGDAVAVTAGQLGVSRQIVWKLRAWLGVETGRNGGPVRGTRDTKAAILAVR